MTEAYGKQHNRRFERTLDFMTKHVSPPAKVLDLGTPNPMATMLSGAGYRVRNTGGQDLDVDYAVVGDASVDVVTAFEIFEHLVAPFNALRTIKAEQLVASVPMRLWFAEAYWSERDPWDRHYHEFEPRQFDMVLDKAGWKVEASEQWTNPSKHPFGIRPFLRLFTPRHYIVYCTRK